MVGINLKTEWFEPEDEFNPSDWDASERAMQVISLFSIAENGFV